MSNAPSERYQSESALSPLTNRNEQNNHYYALLINGDMDYYGGVL